MNTKEQQFTDIIKKHERTIYTVCHMFSDDKDEVNDLSGPSTRSAICFRTTRTR